MLLGSALLCSCGRLSFDQSNGDAATAGDSSDSTSTSDANSSCSSHVAAAVPTNAVIAGTLATPGATAGTCGGPGEEAVFYIDVDIQGSDVLAAADRGTTGDDATSLYVRSSCEDTATELDCDTTDGTGNRPEVHLQNVDAGRYYVFVDALTPGPFDGMIQVLLPAGAACTTGVERDRCGRDLLCTSGTCMPSACALANTLSGPGPFSFTANTTNAVNHHAGTCGAAADGGLRAHERIFLLTLTSAVSDITVSTSNPGTDYDTLVYVRAATCQGLEVGCDDDSGSIQNTSVVHTGAQAAGDYYIFVDGFGASAGAADVSVTLTP